MKHTLALLLLAASLLIGSCKDDDDTTPDVAGYRFQSGDTTITIPDDAITFAQQHYSRDAQLLREFQIATDTDFVNPPWVLGLGVWKGSSFDQRESFMVVPFDRDVLLSDSVFYYHIATFVDQFGFGWMDTFDAASFDPDSAYTGHIWAQSGDAIETVYFDGQSPFLQQYRGMWVISL